MHTNRYYIVIALFAAIAIGFIGTGLRAGERICTGGVQAPSSAPGTLPAADHRPPPWQVAPAAVPQDAPR